MKYQLPEGVVRSKFMCKYWREGQKGWGLEEVDEVPSGQKREGSMTPVRLREVNCRDRSRSAVLKESKPWSDGKMRFAGRIF